MESRSVEIRGAQLQVSDWGLGEPVVFIQTALTADELRPLATDAALDDHRKILYYRRGYAGSSRVEGPGSIAADAADCMALLDELGIERAHVVGLSYSGAVAIQLAADAPEMTHSLTLIEPPPVHTPSAAAFRAVNAQLSQTRRKWGVDAALEEFMTLLVGPDWQDEVEDRLAGSSAQMRREATVFFDTDIPALLEWEFRKADASRIGCPVLYVGGTDSGPWFAEVRELMLSWFPKADNVAIEGADHSLALTHAPQIALALAVFLRRVRITGRRNNPYSDQDSSGSRLEEAQRSAASVKETVVVPPSDQPEDSTDAGDLHDVMLRLATDSAAHFGDREPSDEEMREFLFNRLVVEGKSHEEAARILREI